MPSSPSHISDIISINQTIPLSTGQLQCSKSGQGSVTLFRDFDTNISRIRHIIIELRCYGRPTNPGHVVQKYSEQWHALLEIDTFGILALYIVTPLVPTMYNTDGQKTIQRRSTIPSPATKLRHTLLRWSVPIYTYLKGIHPLGIVSLGDDVENAFIPPYPAVSRRHSRSAWRMAYHSRLECMAVPSSYQCLH